MQKTTLDDTWLVQRLNKPLDQNSKYSALAEVFSFGGGYKNGGLSDKAMEMLRPIFSFDYMGSAEFEFGAVPEFFGNVLKNIKHYSTHEITINKTPVYVICQKNLVEEVDKRIIELSKGKVRLKGGSLFSAAVGLDKYYKKEKCNTFGWLELDNEFMFFTDKEMFEKTAKLFGLIE